MNLAGFNLFNVLKHGALGTGMIDETLAIQNAINAAQAAGGGAIYFPSGQYNVSLQGDGYSLRIASDNILVVGDGPASMITNLSNTGDTILFDEGPSQLPRLNCGVRDLNFFPSTFRDVGSSEIHAPYFNNFHVTGCSFSPANNLFHRCCIKLGNTTVDKVSSIAHISDMDAIQFFTFLYMVQVTKARVYACSTDSGVGEPTTVVIEGGCEGITLSEWDMINTFPITGPLSSANY